MKKVRLVGAIVAAGFLWPAAAGALEDIRDLGPMLETLNDVLSFGRSNVTMNYVSPATGNAGSVEAVRPAGESGGRPCWIFISRYGPPGAEKSEQGRACRDPDGLWVIVDMGTGAPGTLKSTSGGQASPPPAPPPYRRETVYETQELLTLLGYDPGPIDGLYGKRTGAAISAYQSANGLLVDGQPSTALLAHLRASAQAQQTSKAAIPPPAAPSPETQSTVPTEILSPPPAGTAAPGAEPTDAGNVAVAALAADGAAYVGQVVNTSGTYLHYNGNWAKLLANQGSSSEYVYMLLDALPEAQRTTLRNECFLCPVQVTGEVEMRELEFAGSSLGAVPTIVVTQLERQEG
jgi:peptidoglycan hydrolase-like protein with peptidoglycan-binding domain